MSIFTQINYQGRHGEIQVAIIGDSVELIVGDFFVHSTHATQFHGKVHHELPDGTYKVLERKWLLHQAPPLDPHLMVKIGDL